MITLKEKIYQIGMKEIGKAQYNGNLEVSEKYIDKGNFKAHTNMVSNDVYFAYSPKVIEKKPEDKILRIANSATSHEINHHGKEDHPGYLNCEGCPQDVNTDHDLFFLPMYEILSKQGFSQEDVNYATNALQDTILHRDLVKNQKKDLQGIVEFFEDVGESCDKSKFTKFYEAHSKLNMYLWGTKKQKNLLNKFYTNDKKVKEVLDEFFGELNKGKFKSDTEVYTRSKAEFKEKGVFKKKLKRKWIDREDKKIEILDKEAIKDYILDKDNWKEVSEVYAKNFSKLMEPNYALPTMDHSGAGTKGREEEDSSEEGNPFKKERESRPFKQGKVLDSHEKGEKCPPWIDQFEALDCLYEALAQKIEIKADSFVNPETFPISWYGERKFDKERDDFKHIKFGFNDNGEVELKKKVYSVDTPISVKTSPKSFPKIKFGMVDVSPSMTEDINGGDKIGNTSVIPWGDNSKYHWAVLGEFGVFEYFKQNHLLTQDSISAAFFSDNTEIVNGFQEVKDRLLHPKFESTTNLNFDKVKSFFEGEGNLLYTFSDGALSNWDSIKEDFISNAKKHSYVHFHMGTPNSMTKDLKKEGLEVIIAKDGEGIPAQIVDLTDKIVRGTN
jgi:hypothetical protein